MKKLIIILSLFLATSVRAEYVPDGCYVAFSDISRCWAPPSLVVEWEAQPTKEMGEAKYGSINVIIEEWANLDLAVDIATTKTRKDASLIKKLRKACGSKCKKIK